MSPHQERVVWEGRELNEKLERLRSFLAGDIFGTLPAAERERLTRQEAAMSLYLGILAERIAAFA